MDSRLQLLRLCFYVPTYHTYLIWTTMRKKNIGIASYLLHVFIRCLVFCKGADPDSELFGQIRILKFFNRIWILSVLSITFFYMDPDPHYCPVS